MIVILHVTPKPGADESLIAAQAAARTYQLDAVTSCEVLSLPPDANIARDAAEALLTIRRTFYGSEESHRRGSHLLTHAAAATLHHADLKTWHRRMERALTLLAASAAPAGAAVTRAQVLAWIDKEE